MHLVERLQASAIEQPLLKAMQEQPVVMAVPKPHLLRAVLQQALLRLSLDLVLPLTLQHLSLRWLLQAQPLQKALEFLTGAVLDLPLQRAEQGQP